MFCTCPGKKPSTSSMASWKAKGVPLLACVLLEDSSGGEYTGLN